MLRCSTATPRLPCPIRQPRASRLRFITKDASRRLTYVCSVIVVLVVSLIALTGVTWIAARALPMRYGRSRSRYEGGPCSVDVPLGHVQLGASRRSGGLPSPVTDSGVIARPSEELLRHGRHEGLALRRALEDPAIRSWAPQAVNAWESRVERLIGRDPDFSDGQSPRGPILGSSRWGDHYEAGAQVSWLALRIDRRLADLARAIEIGQVGGRTPLHPAHHERPRVGMRCSS